MRLRTTYAQSKDYTYKISTWLARRAIEYGFDRNKFQKSVQALLLDDDDYNTPTLTKQQVKNKKKNAKKKLKKKQQASGDATTKDGEQPEDGEHEDDIEPPASQTDSPTPSVPNTGQQQRQPEMTGDYVIPTEQYVKFANFLAEKKMPIPLELLQIIRRCIRFRLDTLKCFLPKADLSIYTHAFFIDTLRSVGFILHEAREQAFVDNARQHSSSSGNNSRSAQKSETTSNRFASLADLVQDLEETDGDDLEDASAIELSEPPRSTSSSAANGSGNKARFTAVQTTETAIMALLAVLDDFHSVRESISSLWARYSEGKCDLITAALTTNTALELLRHPYNEVISVILPKFNNSIEYLLGHLLEFLSDRSTGDGGRHALVRASMNETDSELSKKELYIYKKLLASPLKLIMDLKSVVKEHPDSLFPELYDDSLDLKTLSVRKRHEQEFLLMCGSYSEMCAKLFLLRQIGR
ncbi:hypothetical protein A4X09_0g3894 [Tilletia walkeri]|uniref:DUF6604 domain-containing protein n=1 Tax=Tilletia walkeri TaxID=117179 RepID=A0A8X7N8F5_9BASI|nr:hypothetical protein A4X09_0g3894 [Tilletia walkeri]